MVSFSTSLITPSPISPATPPADSPASSSPPSDVSFTPLAALTLATTDTPPDRLAELVHHLSDAPLPDACRAVRRHRSADLAADPLTVVAAAMVQLRNEQPKAVA